jgi:hypothetical protein
MFRAGFLLLPSAQQLFMPSVPIESKLMVTMMMDDDLFSQRRSNGNNAFGGIRQDDSRLVTKTKNKNNMTQH